MVRPKARSFSCNGGVLLHNRVGQSGCSKPGRKRSLPRYSYDRRGSSFRRATVNACGLTPWVHERFNLPANLVHHRAGEAVEEFAEDFAFDVAVLDPPWYFPTLTEWLSVASRCVKHGGTILLPLIPEFTRPSAASDAHQVRAAANRIGPTRDTALFAEYDSPRFLARRTQARWRNDWQALATCQDSRDFERITEPRD